MGTIAPTTSYGAIATAGTELGTQAMDILADALSDGTLSALFHMWYGYLPFDLEGCMLEGVTVEEAPDADSPEDAAADGSDGLNSLG